MAQTTRQDRRVEAQAAVDRAMNGNLVKLRSYALMQNNGRYLIGVPPEAPRNLPASKGDEPPVFADFQNGFIVYDMGCGQFGGDSDGNKR